MFWVGAATVRCLACGLTLFVSFWTLYLRVCCDFVVCFVIVVLVFGASAFSFV